MPKKGAKTKDKLAAGGFKPRRRRGRVVDSVTGKRYEVGRHVETIDFRLVDFPITLREQFKKACQRHGSTMRVEVMAMVCEFIEKYGDSDKAGILRNGGDEWNRKRISRIAGREVVEIENPVSGGERKQTRKRRVDPD